MIVERFSPGALIAVCGVLLGVPPAPGLIRQNRQMTRSSAAATYYNRGNQRIRAGDLEGAIKDFDVALTFDPTFAAAYNNRESPCS